MGAVTICSDFGALKDKVCHGFHCFPIYLPWSDRTRCHHLVFWMLSFKPTSSLSSHFHQETLWFFFTFCHKGGVICISKVIDISPAILIPACDLSSPAFIMMYSAYKLNKQGDNIQSWHTPFPIWNEFVAPCQVLTVASWLTCPGLKISRFTRQNK